MERWPAFAGKFLYFRKAKCIEFVQQLGAQLGVLLTPAARHIIRIDLRQNTRPLFRDRLVAGRHAVRGRGRCLILCRTVVYNRCRRRHRRCRRIGGGRA